MPIPGGAQGTETLHCETDNNHMYTMTNVTAGFFDETPFVSGSTRISVSKYCVYDSDYMNMIVGDAKIVDGNVANRRVERKANRTLIVMRVIDTRGFAPKSSKEEFANKIFGIDGDVLNLLI